MLLIIPCGYLILEDARRTTGNFLARLGGNPTIPPPAQPKGGLDFLTTGE